MNTFYLYVKTHKITGLKYLGQTSRNPFKYCGSGVDWLYHLKRFGNDVHTEILLQTQDKEERNYWGRYYSALFNIKTGMDDFGNKIWANRILETGGGGGYEGQSEILKKALNRPEVKAKMIEAQRILNNDPNVRKRKSESALISHSTDEYKIKVTGKNNHGYDHEIYEFTHSDGKIESCTRQQLMKKYNLDPRLLNRMMVGGRKSHRGWSLNSKFVKMKDRA